MCTQSRQHLTRTFDLLLARCNRHAIHRCLFPMSLDALNRYLKLVLPPGTQRVTAHVWINTQAAGRRKSSFSTEESSFPREESSFCIEESHCAPSNSASHAVHHLQPFERSIKRRHVYTKQTASHRNSGSHPTSSTKKSKVALGGITPGRPKSAFLMFSMEESSFCMEESSFL